jgi:hypothetical protein
VYIGSGLYKLAVLLLHKFAYSLVIFCYFFGIIHVADIMIGTMETRILSMHQLSGLFAVFPIHTDAKIVFFFFNKLRPYLPDSLHILYYA